MRLIGLFLCLITNHIIGSSQTLPVEALLRQGVTMDEIIQTANLNGLNGVNGHFLIQQIADDNRLNLQYTPNKKFGLLSPEGELYPLIEFGQNRTNLVYFEFFEERVLIVERKIFSMRGELRISVFDLKKRNCLRMLKGEIPCAWMTACEWLKPRVNKLAFFSNCLRNWGLEMHSLYEYDWRSDNMRFLFGPLPIAIDAGTGRNVELKSVNFNEDKQEFEYLD